MKVFFSAYTCIGNTGDVLINKLQIEEYAQYGEVYVDCTDMPTDFYDVIFNTLNPNIKDYVKVFGISYRGKNMLRTLRLLQKENFTHFTKSPGPYAYIKFPIKTFLKRTIGALGFFLASKKGMRVIALGIDLNYNKETKWIQKLNSKYFRIYNLLGIRSIQNANQLSKCLGNVRYIPDMAFLYPAPADIPRLKDRKRIALSFRTVDNNEDLIERLKNICDFFCKRNYEIEIIYQVEEDEVFCERLNMALDDFNVFFRKQLITFEQLHTYSQYAYVISNRLHVALMGAIHGAIPYALISHNAKEQKLGNIFDSAFSIKLWCYQEGMNDTILEDVFTKQESISRRLRDDISKQRDLCKATIKSCFL